MTRNLCVLLFGCCLFFVGVLSAHDEETEMELCEIVHKHGYPCHSLNIHTEDGYMLKTFRIVHGKNDKNITNRPPVLLQHGLLDSAISWLVNDEPGQSLAFLLADAGFDVWLGNNRGNRYSREHEHLSSDEPAFWKFTFDEMVVYDWPAMIEHIYRNTSRRVFYVGHSQGTLQAFGGLSLRPDLESKLQFFAALGPVINPSHMKNPVFLAMAKLHGDSLIKVLGDREFMPSMDFINRFAPGVCDKVSFVCNGIIQLFVGWDLHSFNSSRMQFVASKYPGGTSSRNIRHWSQSARASNFQFFDHGLLGNIKAYGQIRPPKYPVEHLKHLKVPMMVYYGGSDVLATVKDVDLLLKLLPDGTPAKKIEPYNHLDFMWAMDSNKLIYFELMGMLSKVLAA